MIDSNVTIAIPARYASSRLPGKPLHLLAGKPMLQWVIEAAQAIPHTKLLVATDDLRIAALASSLHVEALLTPAECSSGTERIYAALQQLEKKPNYIINLQGDAPLTNPDFIQKLIAELTNPHKSAAVVTPAMRLTWQQYDHLVNNKISSPNSGTLCIKGHDDLALWFSKQIIPAVRNIENLRKKSPYSPYLQHLGLYGYTYAALEQFVNLPTSMYEELECLEQLRFLENNIPIKLVMIEGDSSLWSGVDTIDDAHTVDKILSKK